MDQRFMTPLPHQVFSIFVVIARLSATEYLAGRIEYLDNVALVKTTIHGLYTDQQHTGQAFTVQKNIFRTLIDSDRTGRMVICTGEPSLGR